MDNKVSLLRSTYEDVQKKLPTAIELAGGLEGLKSGSKVSIKINFCDARTPETGAITHPLFLDALLAYLRKSYSELDIYVVEADATVVFADEFIKWFGYMPVLEKWGAKWHNLSKGEILKVKIENGRYFKEVPVPRILKDSFYISMPKLKTNSLSTITGALKNQFGCMPMAQKSVYHDFLADVISDCNLAMKPDFSIVDGIIGQGGAKGPAFGVPIRGNLIICGKDPVAVDSVCAKVMKYNPKGIKHISLCEANGTGSTDFDLTGDPIPDIDWENDRFEMFIVKLAQFILKMQRSHFRGSWRKKK